MKHILLALALLVAVSARATPPTPPPFIPTPTPTPAPKYLSLPYVVAPTAIIKAGDQVVHVGTYSSGPVFVQAGSPLIGKTAGSVPGYVFLELILTLWVPKFP